MQNELIVGAQFKSPKINWRVYYSDDGHILACSPTPLIDLVDNKFIGITAELGKKLVSGKVNPSDYRVVQAAGVMKLIEIAAEEPHPTSDQKTITGSLKYYQIDTLGNPTDYLIGITVLPAKGQILFQANPRNRTAALAELNASNGPTSTALFVTKKNDPSWLYARIELPISEILQQGVLIKPWDVNDESFSIFTENYVEGLTIFNDKTNKRADIQFYEFINDLTNTNTPSFIGAADAVFPIFDMLLYENKMTLSIHEEYRKPMQDYVNSSPNVTGMTFTVMDRNKPYFYLGQVSVDFKELPWNDVEIELPTDDPLLMVNINSPSSYFQVHRRSDVFNHLVRAIGIQKEPILIEPQKSDTAFIDIIVRRKSILISLNSKYEAYLRRCRSDLTVEFSITDSKVTKVKFNIKELLNGSHEILVDSVPSMIYIDVPNPNLYFQIHRR